MGNNNKYEQASERTGLAASFLIAELMQWWSTLPYSSFHDAAAAAPSMALLLDPGHTHISAYN